MRLLFLISDYNQNYIFPSLLKLASLCSSHLKHLPVVTHLASTIVFFVYLSERWRFYFWYLLLLHLACVLQNVQPSTTLLASTLLATVPQGVAKPMIHRYIFFFYFRSHSLFCFSLCKYICLISSLYHRKAFVKAWKDVCGATQKSAKFVIPQNKIFMLQPLSLKGPCNPATIEVQVVISYIQILKLRVIYISSKIQGL